MILFGCSIPLCAASILRGCEPTGNVSRTQLVPSASQDGYKDDILTTESSSNGNPKTAKKCKKKRIAVPLEKKDDKYWERRRRNNLAAKRCRELKRHKQLKDTQIADKCIQENGRLRAEISAYRLEIDTLRRLLGYANTTLSLFQCDSVHARQADNPPDRLPPTVTNCNDPPHSSSMSSFQQKT